MTGAQHISQPASPGNWTADAACQPYPADTFTVTSSKLLRRSPGERNRVARAKQICTTCPVLADCRTWALTTPDPAFEHVAGGLDPNERAAIRKGTTS